MKIFSKLMFASVLGAAALTGLAQDSFAGARLNLFYAPAPYFVPGYDGYYEEPAYIPPPRRARQYYYYDYYPRPVMPQDMEEDYYEPQYESPQAERFIPREEEQASRPLAPQTEIAPPEKKKTSALSCSKAGKVISGYGFSDITSTDCKGQIYAFNATRDGKKFAIKLNSVSGELTEVKKL